MGSVPGLTGPLSHCDCNRVSARIDWAFVYAVTVIGSVPGLTGPLSIL